MSVTTTSEFQVYSPKGNANSAFRRTRYDIWAEILDSCIKVPRTQSWLLVKLGLSSVKAKESITFLLSSKLIEKFDGSKLGVTKYATTEKGREALSTYRLLINNFFSLIP